MEGHDFTCEDCGNKARFQCLECAAYVCLGCARDHWSES